MRFYRIDISNIDMVESARFFKLMYRLPVYDGVIAARIQQEKESDKKRVPSKVIRENPNVKMVEAEDLISLEQSSR